MSEQIKADFARAQKLIKAEQYAQAIAILKPHAAHPRIAALLADLESKQKPAGGNLKTVLWIVLVVVVGIIAGGGGYALGESRTSAEYELPPSMEAVFVRICTANSDLSFEDCSRGIRAKWLLHRGPTQECYSQINDVPDLTDSQFLDCILDTGE
jgi:hypothetical protein